MIFQAEAREVDSMSLIHVIIWPAIGAFVILILFVLLLYYVSVTVLSVFCVVVL